ncbi:alpha/beta fold hydrolase [Pseudonocardia sp. HH130630-07]|uniref:alpha/beta fold hydrolase n=1 Tax=Pseudonocardia sp. HH130630-07 TaxID=1690815 RepID=UPI000814DCEA|nr:alpha/beta hydrolase [Pseudonocardia sp. HH130630-07]ANY09232.1 hypothetical protein AFB00_26645 [Pseudonocardia sp. HH130630-07]
MSGTEDIVTSAGPMYVTRWDGASEPVLAVHGVSSTGLLWRWLHDAAPDLTLIAPDLAGRGGTPASAVRPSSPAAHADRLADLTSALDLGPVHVIGMSMGGFVATEFAVRHPELTRSVTLVDGGLPLPGPPAPVGATTARLRAAYASDGVWPDPAAYARHYCSTAAPLCDPADPRTAEVLAHELVPAGDGVRVARDLDTVVEDAVSIFCSSAGRTAFDRLAVPVRALYAAWSVGPDTPPLYPATHVSALVGGSSALVSAELLPEADHAATVMTDRGARACARVLRASVDDAGRRGGRG